MDQILNAEELLIEQAKKGDQNAYGELVISYYEAVIRLVYHLCGEKPVAQDAAQEAFIRAWIKLPEFRSGTSIRNWIYRIAINAAVDLLRQRKMTSLDDSEEIEMADQSPDPESIYVEKERTAFVQHAMTCLPEAAREVLVLREYGGLTYSEISSILDIPIGTVMSRLNYGRNRLRDILESQKEELELRYV